jgi:DNA-directed RNA polymerase specialized sigma24 family protein
VAGDDLLEPGPIQLPPPVEETARGAWEEMAPFGSGDDPEAEALAVLDRRAVHRAMWSLSEEQRTAIALVDLGGLSTVEAARIMGTPRGTVLSRLHRGRRALALLLRGVVDQGDADSATRWSDRTQPLEEES